MSVLWQLDGTVIPDAQGSGLSIESSDGIRPPVYRVDNSEGLVVRGYKILDAPVDKLSFRFYFKTVGTLVGNATPIFDVYGNTWSDQVLTISMSGSGQPGQVRASTVGKANEVLFATGTISTDSWYRIEGQIEVNPGSVLLRVYEGDSTSAIGEAPVSVGYLGPSLIGRLGFGVVKDSLANVMLFDDILVTDSLGWIGPWTQPTPKDGYYISVMQDGVRRSASVRGVVQQGAVVPVSSMRMVQ